MTMLATLAVCLIWCCLQYPACWILQQGMAKSFVTQQKSGAAVIHVTKGTQCLLYSPVTPSFCGSGAAMDFPAC